MIHTGDSKMSLTVPSPSITHLLLRRGSLFKVANGGVGQVAIRLILSANKRL